MKRGSNWKLAFFGLTYHVPESKKVLVKATEENSETTHGWRGTDREQLVLCYSGFSALLLRCH